MSDFALPSLGPGDVNLLRPVATPTTAGADAARIRRTAQDFEASFLSVMFNQMFEGVSTAAPFGGGQGEEAFRSFLTEAMAKSMVQKGGIGLSSQITHELMKLQGAA
jgi:Rod binding domain-containing protein